MENPYNLREAAKHYDVARQLPTATTALWLGALKSAIGDQRITSILDLGCGTGRFSTALGEAFSCRVIGVEPSAAMLQVARNREDISWLQGQAENLPLSDGAVDLVFMSQVFHHLIDSRTALNHIRRVLKPGGFLAIRNGMREENESLKWLEFFPEAKVIEDRRAPSRSELTGLATGHGFQTTSHQILHQLFADSSEDYFKKITSRGLSSLISIDDACFRDGVERMAAWLKGQPPGLPVYEPVDLFVFRKGN
ncbi:MAG: class I SAM-dependent methyltransferase [Acidobacteriota bacterium]